MGHALKMVAVILLGAGVFMGTAGLASAESGLSIERAGLGLKPPDARVPPSEGFLQRSELADMLQPAESAHLPYAGVRETTRLGLRTTESYVGVYSPLSDGWGVSVEMGVVPETGLAPRRYSVAGQLQTALAAGGSLSVGLKYRVYEPDLTSRSGAPGEITAAYAYTLTPLRIPGAAPSYQLQLSYQYNAANMFGLALGRELETFTPGFDLLGAGPRQFSFTGQHWLSPSWALSYDLLANDPANPFRLQGLRFGMRYRF